MRCKGTTKNKLTNKRKMFFLVKNTLRYACYKNNQKYFNGDLVAMLNYRLSYECWAAFPHSCKHGFGQTPHHSLSAKQPRATKVLQCSSNFSKSFGVYQPCGLWVLLRCASKAQHSNEVRKGRRKGRRKVPKDIGNNSGSE